MDISRDENERRYDVTVIMPVYNEEGNIRDAIESLLNQTYENIEILIINDGSNDRTKDIINEEYLPNEKIRLHNQKNKGFAKSLNEGLNIADSEFVARLDADDRCKPTRIEKQVKYLRNNEDVGVVGTGYLRIDHIRKEKYSRLYPEKDKEIRKEMSKYIPIAHSSVMFRRNSVEQVGGYDEELATFGIEDIDLWMRIAENWKLGNIPEPLVVRHIRGDSYWHRNVNSYNRDFQLSKVCVRAIKKFKLPKYYYVYPLLRLIYTWFPSSIKKLARNSVSKIKEY
jgi:glycosyltransferase involved in cell wall biosynthesis